jgi:PAT family acetyl-CoA transporter-like MFS transporter 1
VVVDKREAKLIQKKMSEEGIDYAEPEDDETLMKKNKKMNMTILIFLYFLQGLPLGLTGAIPLLMSSKKVSYSAQGTFSFAFWPFSIKLLWAPIVDSLYFKRFGRRKSWVVPVQILLGLYLILFAAPVKNYLSMNSGGGVGGDGSDQDQEDSNTYVYKLTGIFFFFTFMAATQDIAVDGWGLNMFAK